MTASLKLHRKRYLNYPPNKKIYILTLSINRQILTNQNCEVNIRSLNPIRRCLFMGFIKYELPADWSR